MKFMEINENHTEDESIIIDDANEAVDKMMMWKKLENKRYIYKNSIERAIKLKFPRITYVNIEHDSISLETELHTNRISKYQEKKNKNIPTFKCNVQNKDMPDTIEDFLAMKENIKADKQEIMTVMNYISFRYDIYNTK